MKKFLEKYKFYIIVLASFMIYLLTSTALCFFTNISAKVFQVLNLLVMCILFFIFGFKRGKKVSSKGLLNGIKIGLILVLIFYILKLIFVNSKLFDASLIYYLVLILCSGFGGALGVNKK